MSVRVNRKKGSFDFAHPNEEQVSITIYLPDEAPQGAVSCTWKDEYKAPGVSNVPPSAVAKELKEKIKRKISTHKEEDLEAIEWIEDNAQDLDCKWAQRKIRKKKEKVERLEKEVRSLHSQYVSGNL